MKITCSQSDLLKGLSMVGNAVPVRTTMSILECVLVDASTNEIHLTANNMELGIETVIPGKIIERGKIALDNKIFSGIVRSLPNETVTITTDDRGETYIDCENGKHPISYTISGKSGEDFPYLPVIPRRTPITISQFTLHEVIMQTIFSIANDESNHMMSGELFDLDGDRLRIVSLDGHRISIRHVRLKESYNKQSVIVPGKTMTNIAKIVNGSVDDMVTIYIAENHIIFEFDQTMVISRLIDGEYFAIDKMLSDDYESKITINRRELAESIRRATPMISEIDKKPVVLDIHDQVFHMSITSSKGNYEEELNMVKEGRDIKIAFNPKFISDVLRVIEDENVVMYLLTPKSPCFIRDEAGNYIYLILPVNFNG